MTRFSTAFLCILAMLIYSSIAVAQTLTPVTSPTLSLPQITDWVTVAKFWFEVLAQAIMTLVILASIIAKIYPKMRPGLDAVSSKVLKIIQWLPTFGFSPRTLELEKALAELQRQLDEKAKSEK
jgi:hypothetical protein